MILLDVMADSDQNVQSVVESPNVDQASVTSEGGEVELAERNEETVSEVTVTEKMLDRATENNDGQSASKLAWRQLIAARPAMIQPIKPTLKLTLCLSYMLLYFSFSG